MCLSILAGVAAAVSGRWPGRREAWPPAFDRLQWNCVVLNIEVCCLQFSLRASLIWEPKMNDNSSSFIHKVFFTSKRAFAELCASRIRSTHPELCVDIHFDFELYLAGVYKKITDTDLILINYYFTDEVVLAFPALDRFRNLNLTFLVCEGIDGVGFDLIQYAASRNPDVCSYSQPYQVISSGVYEGCHIRKNKSRFLQKLISKIQTLNIVKSFVPKVPNYFFLDNFLDSRFQKLQRALRARGGILVLEEKKGSRTIFRKKYGKALPDLTQSIRLDSPICQTGFVKDMPESVGSEAQPCEATPAVANICASFETSNARGYFKINAEDPITACVKTLVKVFNEQIGLFIDNIISTQEKLERLNLNLSLMEPEVDEVMIIDKSREFDPALEMSPGRNKDELSGRQYNELSIVGDDFGTQGWEGKTYHMNRLGKKHQNFFENHTRSIGNGAKSKKDCGLDRDRFGGGSEGKTVKDVSERLYLENKSSHLAQLAWLGEYATEFAHEIRNPITGISSSAQFLYETADIAEEHKTVIEEILLGSKILEETVKKYLNLAKPPDPRLEKCSLNLLLEQVCKSLQTKIASQNITIEFKLGEDLPKIYVDPEQVRQVYVNLIMNALEAMTEGGKLAIKTFLRAEEADSETSQCMVVVSSISDSGIGINPRDTDRVFDPFYTTKHSGIGLGLYTSFNILKKHNAEIHLFSERGKGTEVTVDFPLSSNL